MSNELQKKLAEMKVKYLASLPEKVAEIRELWLSASSAVGEKGIEELHRKAHSLAGSSATFDQVGLSKAAKALEDFVKDHSEAGDLFSENNAIEVNHLLKQINASFDGEQAIETPEKEDMPDLKAIGLDIKKMRILIADDDDDNRNRLSLILTSSGHEVYTASDGQSAVDLNLKHKPDLILMDVIMPNMTGYEAAAQIKKSLAGKFTPILFLTAVTDSEALVRCVTAGGDDFINKPVHPLILHAKLAAFQRIIHMYETLDDYQRKNEEEMTASKEVLDSVIYKNDQNIPGLQTWAKSPGHFSGDTRMFKQLDDGRIYILLCDFTGHGLPAAIGTVFVSDLFRSMTSKNIPALAILNEINSKMNQILPVGRYCAAIMLVYEPEENKMTMWSCGLPDAYVTDANHKITATYASEGVPLGVLSGEINSTPYEIDTTDINEIVIFSDGITEAEDPNGNMYGDEKLKQLIENTDEKADLFIAIKTDLETFMDGEEPTDDISLIVYKF